MLAARTVVRLGGNAQDVGQGARAGVATGRTTIDIRLAVRHRFRVRTATGEAALTALGLRQDAVEAVGQIHGAKG
ncbi:hypothetical protein GCM10027159_05770 [Lysobacter terrae]